MTYEEFWNHKWVLGETVYIVEYVRRQIGESIFDNAYLPGRLLKARVVFINFLDYPEDYFYDHQKGRQYLFVQLESDDLEDYYSNTVNLTMCLLYNKTTGKFEDDKDKNYKLFLCNKFLDISGEDEIRKDVTNQYNAKINAMIQKLNNDIKSSKKTITASRKKIERIKAQKFEIKKNLEKMKSFII